MNNINDLRVKNLSSLVREAGSIANLARKYKIDATYISQILSGHRNLGEKAARKIESMMNLDQNWFDQKHDVVDLSQDGFEQTYDNHKADWPFFTISITEYRLLSKQDKEEIEAIIRIKLGKR